MLSGVFGIEAAVPVFAWMAAVLGLGLAGYTAFLFGQAEARDLWQSPTLLWHMLAGAFAAGGGAGLVFGLVFELGETTETAITETGIVFLGGNLFFHAQRRHSKKFSRVHVRKSCGWTP